MNFSIKIDDIEYSIPDLYTVEQWTRLSQWSLEDKDSWCFIIAQATGAPADKLIEIEKDEPELIIFMISLVFSSLELRGLNLQPVIGPYKLIDYNSMSVGQFIDLDVLAIDRSRFTELVAALYGMEVQEVKPLEINLVLPAVQNYLRWRRSVYQSYKDLFNYNETAPESSNEFPKLSPAHAWYETLMALCDGQFDKIEYVVQRPYREAFNFLAWKKTKLAEQKMEIEKMQRNFSK